jgi:hypothetical protein
LENSPGRLANLLDILGRSKIMVRAMEIAEVGNYGIVRMIVDDDEKALKVLREANMAVNQANVIVIDLEKITSAVNALGDVGVNIEYAYTMDNRRVILKVNNEAKALNVLSNSRLKIYTTND